MNIWVQRADTSTIDIKADTAEKAIKVFNGFDWKKAREEWQKMDPDTCVPPGLGLGDLGDTHFMHITLNHENNLDIWYVKTTSAFKKILGFIPSTSKISKESVGKNIKFEQAEELLKAYYTADEAAIMKYCNE